MIKINKIIIYTILISFFSLALPNSTTAVEINDFFEMQNLTESSDGYYTMEGEDGNKVLKTHRILHVGDEYIDQNNTHYRVVEVEDRTAHVEEVDETTREVNFSLWDNYISTWITDLKNWSVEPHLQVSQEDNRRIAVYHSHGAESYVPTDGEESILEGGGILEVGEAFTQALEENNIEVIHEKDETHVPHDAGAYQRSRRTAEEMIKAEPVALFDVHRDAVPPEEYLAEVDGQEMVQVLLVVGRQNQNMDTNNQFAEELKATSDEMHPNLVKGILLANGSYNQDLSARSLLMEVGSHESDREQAEESIQTFAGVVSNHLFGNGEVAQPGVDERAGSTALRSVLWLIGIAIAGSIAFLFISTGSWEEAMNKLKHFRRKEFLNNLKLPNRNKDDNHDD